MFKVVNLNSLQKIVSFSDFKIRKLKFQLNAFDGG
jgi:hypothetical protein